MGENDVHSNIGEVCPVIVITIMVSQEREKCTREDVRKRVEEHLEASQIQNTLCGEQGTTLISSDVKVPNVWSSTSASRNFETMTHVGAPC